MKSVLLIYRGRVFDTEINPRLEEFKNDNITLVTENKYTRNSVSYLIEDYTQQINLFTIDEFLDDNIITKFMKFDVVIGNYPYERSVGPSKTEPIWHLFAEKVFRLLKEGGYLSVIHPSAWRTSKGKFTSIKDLYLSKKIISLDLNDFNKGREVFGAGTNFDIVTLINTPFENGFKTKIIDDKDEEYFMELIDIPFIPNSNFEKILSLVAKDGEETVDVLYERSSYGSDKRHMSSTKNLSNKYPCVYTITKKDGINMWYSSTKDNGLFNIPKVIWTNGLGTYPIIDKTGEYGLTQFAYAISDDSENLENIKSALESESFLNLMKSIRFTNHIYDYKIISTFRKDFWKEFIND
jgi:hypothetical protein